mgnify:CR=1 FL=1
MKEFFINYAEGRKELPSKYDRKEEATSDAEKLSEKLGVKVLTFKAVCESTPKDITKRVKTYADACAVLGIEPINEDVLTKLGFTKDEMAYRKLKTIVEALNEGWRPNWLDSNEYKYWPWFYIEEDDGANGGLAYASTSYAPSLTITLVGSRLCFKTDDLATYAAKQFIDIYNEYLLYKD